MSEQQPPHKPKLIVDEDWKTKVQAEREAAQQPPTSQESSPPEPTSQAAPQIPPASLPMLVTTLATQAMAALGQVPDASGKPAPPQLELARHFIDTLAVLEEKTKGNLTPQESAMLTSVLHELRMVFVEVKKT